MENLLESLSYASIQVQEEIMKLFEKAFSYVKNPKNLIWFLLLSFLIRFLDGNLSEIFSIVLYFSFLILIFISLIYSELYVVCLVFALSLL